MSHDNEYLVVIGSVWLNRDGYGISYSAEGDRHPDRETAIQEGWEAQGSDDFNIAVVRDNELISFDWMDKPTGEDHESMCEIAGELGLIYHPEEHPND